MTTPRDHFVSLAVLALLWLGMLAGVSFLATPVKFMAPSLSLPVALDVGRQTFTVFNRVEIGLGMALLVFAAFSLHGRAAGRHARMGSALALLALVLAQTLWLLPVLDARVEIILQGGMPPASRLHFLYILVDLAKLALLAFTAWTSLRGAALSRGRAAGPG